MLRWPAWHTQAGWGSPSSRVEGPPEAPIGIQWGEDRQGLQKQPWVGDM